MPEDKRGRVGPSLPLTTATMQGRVRTAMSSTNDDPNWGYASGTEERSWLRTYGYARGDR